MLCELAPATAFLGPILLLCDVVGFSLSPRTLVMCAWHIQLQDEQWVLSSLLRSRILHVWMLHHLPQHHRKSQFGDSIFLRPFVCYQRSLRLCKWSLDVTVLLMGPPSPSFIHSVLLSSYSMSGLTPCPEKGRVGQTDTTELCLYLHGIHRRVEQRDVIQTIAPNK